MHNGFSREGGQGERKQRYREYMSCTSLHALFLFLIRVVIGFSLDALRRPCVRFLPYAILGQASSFAFTRPVRSYVYAVLRYSCCTLRLNGGTLVRTGSMEGSIPSLVLDRKSTRLNSSHSQISYAVF